LFSLPDCANIGFNMSEPLVRALKVSKIMFIFENYLLDSTDFIKLQVDALSPDDPVVVMPCLTVLRTLQPVFFDNLETDTKV
jgi:U3 small nucleolar RNA-associated protein 10